MTKITQWLCRIGLHAWEWPRGYKSQPRKAVWYRCARNCGATKVVDESERDVR
jgi:hypothetical protein